MAEPCPASTPMAGERRGWTAGAARPRTGRPCDAVAAGSRAAASHTRARDRQVRGRRWCCNRAALAEDRAPAPRRRSWEVDGWCRWAVVVAVERTEAARSAEEAGCGSCRVAVDSRAAAAARFAGRVAPGAVRWGRDGGAEAASRRPAARKAVAAWGRCAVAAAGRRRARGRCVGAGRRGVDPGVVDLPNGEDRRALAEACPLTGRRDGTACPGRVGPLRRPTCCPRRWGVCRALNRRPSVRSGLSPRPRPRSILRVGSADSTLDDRRGWSGRQAMR